ncbi:hypothetical protein CR513_58243, partial [Mucuna pruriens]
MLQLLEERLDTLEGVKQSDFDAADLCLVPNIVIPPKFELLAFDKYEKTTCPKRRWLHMPMMIFIDTLHLSFYEKTVGNMVSNFSDLVLIGERIEAGMRTRKIVPEAVASHPNEFPNSEEGEEAT